MLGGRVCRSLTRPLVTGDASLPEGANDGLRQALAELLECRRDLGGSIPSTRLRFDITEAPTK